jgi:subtilase family serine protease
LESRATPASLSPAQIRHAYGFDQIAFPSNGQSIVGDGRGQTIAIVDAFHNPTVANDADVFDRAFTIGGSQSLFTQYGPASQFLTVATPQGTPATDAGWSEEIALDVEWAHAIAPGAHILLVEAKSDSLTDLLAAVDYARRQPTVAAVSMSWGANEFRSEASFDSYFTTPARHTGVTFVGASGDNGAPATWPSVSSNVLAVGGSTLRVDSAGNYLSESAWGGSGGGVSSFVSRPNFQSSLLGGATRGAPDVSFDANPSTGFSVYSASHWRTIGGTSAGAPQWAALVAIADQGRALNGRAALDTGAALSAIYGLSASDFHDVTTGSNGYAARAGYDLATGRGSPIANRVVNDLAGFRNSTPPTTTNNGGTTTGSGTSNSNFWWFRWWFNPPFFGVTVIQMATEAAPTTPTFAVTLSSSMTSDVANQTLQIAMPTTKSAVNELSDANFARPVNASFGNGVARLDWSDETDSEDDLEFVLSE